MEARRRGGLPATLAARVLDEIRLRRLEAGEHLTVQALADQFGVSRSPIAKALCILASEGVVHHHPQRGYFVALPDETAPQPSLAHDDPVEGAYLALADDRLEGRVPEVVSVSYLKDRYRLTPAQSQSLVTRVIKEGWLERRAGYGL